MDRLRLLLNQQMVSEKTTEVFLNEICNRPTELLVKLVKDRESLNSILNQMGVHPGFDRVGVVSALEMWSQEYETNIQLKTRKEKEEMEEKKKEEKGMELVEKPVEQWTTDEVVQWALKIKDVLPVDAEILLKQRVTGHTLLNLTKQDLINAGIPLGPASSLINEIDKLKGTSQGLTLSNVGNQKLEPPDKFFELETMDNFNIYWFLEEKLKPGNDNIHKFNLTSVSFTSYLPIYLEDQNSPDLQKFKNWINEQVTEYHSTLIFYPPGVGKTTITRWASVLAGAVYVRFPGNKTIMKSIKTVMQNIKPENEDDIVNVEELTRKLSIISLKAISKMCELIYNQISSSNGFRKYCIQECGGNGFHYKIENTLSTKDLKDMYEDALQCANNAFNQLYLFCNRTVVIHLDEMQDWELNVNVNHFNRKYEGYIQSKEAQNYFILAFSEAIQEAVSGIDIRFVFSGTLLTLKNHFRLGSKLKLTATSFLPKDLTSEQVKIILSIFCNFPENILEELSQKLAGPGRILQNFLEEFYRQKIIPDYMNLLEIVLEEYFFNGLDKERKKLNVPQNIWEMLVIIMQNAQLLGGIWQDNGWLFPTGVLPEKWIEWSSSGLFCLIFNHRNNIEPLSQIFLPFPSYPYRWYARKQVKNISDEQFQLLLSAVNFRRGGNENVVGYVFSTALSLELLIPNTSLYRRITEYCQQFIPEVLLPQPEMEKVLILCRNDNEFNNLQYNQVGIAVDDPTKGSKYGDIAFTMSTFKEERKVYKFRAEVKAHGYVAMEETQYKKVRSTLLQECLTFFKRKVDFSNIDCVIFFCWFPLLEWVQNKMNKLSGISKPRNSENKTELIEFLKKPGYILIDNIKMLPHTILDLNTLLLYDTGDNQRLSLMKGIPYLPSQDFTYGEQDNDSDNESEKEAEKSKREQENESEKESKKRLSSRREQENESEKESKKRLSSRREQENESEKESKKRLSSRNEQESESENESEKESKRPSSRRVQKVRNPKKRRAKSSPTFHKKKKARK